MIKDIFTKVLIFFSLLVIIIFSPTVLPVLPFFGKTLWCSAAAFITVILTSYLAIFLEERKDNRDENRSNK